LRHGGPLLVLHFHDVSSPSASRARSLNVSVVSALGSWVTLLDRIAHSELVVSTSLHGIICAEALGVPARFLWLNSGENIFKYQDYYSGTNRTLRREDYATSVEEALQMGGAPLPIWDPRPLIDAFPWELYPEAQPLSLSEPPTRPLVEEGATGGRNRASQRPGSEETVATDASQ